MLEKLREYQNNHKSIRELIKRKSTLKTHQEAIKILAYRIGSLEQQIVKDSFIKDDPIYPLIKEEILDVYDDLSILAQDILANYLQSINTLEEYRPEQFQNDKSSKSNHAWIKKTQLTQYIYESYLLSLINVHALFETVKLLMHKVEETFDSKIYDELSETIYGTFLTIDKYQNTKIISLLHKVATAKSFEESWQLYKANRMLLSEFVIIKQNKLNDQNCQPVDLFSIFPSKNTPNYPIYSFWGNNKVNFLSYRVLLSPRNMCVNERNISFDTNIISYFKSWIEKGKSSVDLTPVLEFLSNPQTQYDYFPFMAENYLSQNYTKEELIIEIDQIERDLSNYKLYPYRPEYAQQLVNTLSDPNMVNPLKDTYNRIYLTMLVIVWVKLHYSNQPAEKQFQKLCDIMASELNNYPLPELAMAYDYYNNSDNTASFFRKIQKNKNNLLKNIKNMAWDLFHISLTIQQCLVKLTNTDLMIPYFATYDKGLAKILKYYEMESLAICYRTNEYFPYYSMSNIPLEVRNKYFRSHLENAPININKLIEKYENMVGKV